MCPLLSSIRGYRALLTVAILAGMVACKPDPILQESAGQFPTAVAEIFIARCATPGCHNDKSTNLDLSSWGSLFKGSRSGSPVIPGHPEQSFLLYAVNTYPEFGDSLEPTMPYTADPAFPNEPLTREEVKTLRDWIAAGARNSRGESPFPDVPRDKVYVINQGCDLVAVLDAESRQIIRYVEVGRDPASIESPHMIRVSPDGRYWYVVFVFANVVQVYATINDQLVSEIPIPGAIDDQWNTFRFSQDGKYAFIVGTRNNHIVTLALDGNGGGQYMANATQWNQPHGVEISHDNQWLYVTGQSGNAIYKVDLDDPTDLELAKHISLQAGIPARSNQSDSNQYLDPHELEFHPERDILFVTCQNSNDLRIVDTKLDTVIDSIPLGTYPQEMVISRKHNLLLVSCMQDKGPEKFDLGSVYAIDLNTYQVVGMAYTGYQPHGMAVDESRNTLWVASRNFNTDGPVPHHVSGACGSGRNGFLTLLELPGLTEIKGYKPEVSVDPYGAAFKKAQ